MAAHDWSLRIQQFDFDIIDRKDTLHSVADALTRIAAINIIPLDRNIWYTLMLTRVHTTPDDFKFW